MVISMALVAHEFLDGEQGCPEGLTRLPEDLTTVVEGQLLAAVIIHH